MVAFKNNCTLILTYDLLNKEVEIKELHKVYKDSAKIKYYKSEVNKL
jgi:hypothetical protein